jgi:arabinogalactan endo-1,4-beta-galactosidase
MLAAAAMLIAPFWSGFDGSFIPQYRDLKVPFYVGKQKTDPMEALQKAGFDLLRLRLWVDPKEGYCGLEKSLAMAKEAKKRGMALLLDFHYSDTWADPAHQPTPRAWVGLNLEQMKAKVKDYSRSTIAAFVKQGTPPTIVQIGNEVTPGMVWPTGKIYETGWDGFLDLVRAGISGTKQACPTAQIMLHIDCGGDNQRSRYFFDHIRDAKIDYDLIGLSYYPFWHGTLDDLKLNLNDLSERYSKRVMVVETAYAFSLEGRDKTGNFVTGPGQLLKDYAPTPEGQGKFLATLRKIVKEVKGGKGAGVVYWAPEFVAAPGMETPYENLTLFDFENRLLPGATALTGKG